MINLNIMTNEKLTELLKIAYRWGRDNGSNRSEKNFNDLLQTEAISKALRIHDVVGQSEQLVCDKCGYPMFYHKPEDIMYCHGCNNTKPAN